MRSQLVTALVVIATRGLFVSGAVVTNTWTGSANANWFNGGNWSQATYPADGEAIVVNNGTILLTNFTAKLASFAMSAGTLTFSNWYTKLEATDISLTGGAFTLPSSFTTNQMSNRVWIVCSNNFTLGPSASINTDSRGYAGGVSGNIGNGPGGGRRTSYG